MRIAFIDTLCELAAADPRIWLLTGDLGYGVLERFRDRFPDRFVNAGVAEQNMTGVATGLALSGAVVFIYSIANFPTFRCLEQVRNDVSYHRANVKIVTVGGGFAYGSHGYTHFGIEDLAVMRVLPNMTVVAPGDPVETRLATRAVADWAGPCYLRLGRGGEVKVHQAEPDFKIGKAITVRKGKDVTLISTGGMLGIALQAAEALSAQKYSAHVLSMPTLSPLDQEAVLAAARATGKIVTVEEHGLGGLGSAVAQVLAEAGCPAKFISLHVQRKTIDSIGTQEALLSSHGLDRAGLVAACLKLLQG